MATASKQKNGTWRAHADLRSITGKQVTRAGFLTKKAATAWAQEVEVEARARKVVAHLERDMFGPFVSGLTLYRGDVHGTQDRYNTILRKQILPAWEGKYLDEISYVAVEAWLLKLRREDDLAYTTIAAVFGLFRKIIRHAMASGLIRKDPTIGSDGKRVQLPTGDSREAHIVTMSQAEHLADYINPRFAAAVLVMAYGGLRVSEALALRRSDLDVDSNIVYITHGQRRVVGGISLAAPKSKSSRRPVTVPNFVMEALVGTWGMRQSVEWIFPTERGTMMRYDSFVYRFWFPACEKAGLTDFRPHDLRHSHATDLIDAGVHVNVVKERLGHSSIKITMDLYGHRIKGKDASVAALLEERRANQRRPKLKVV